MPTIENLEKYKGADYVLSLTEILTSFLSDN